MENIKKYFKTPTKQTAAVYGTVILVLITAFLVIYFTFGKTLTEFVTDTQSFNEWLSAYDKQSALVFLFIRAFQTAIKIIPSEPLEIASGYAFGTWGGLFYCSLGTFLGSLVIVFLSKVFGRKFVSVFVNEAEINKLRVISDKGSRRLVMFVFYLIPGTPKDLFTYVAASTDFNLTEFFIITTIARIPSIITSTICGSQILQQNYKAAVIVFAATAVVSVISGIIYKYCSNKQLAA